jgi:hypothetical protein
MGQVSREQLAWRCQPGQVSLPGHPKQGILKRSVWTDQHGQVSGDSSAWTLDSLKTFSLDRSAGTRPAGHVSQDQASWTC